MRKEFGEITYNRRNSKKYAQIATNHSITKECHALTGKYKEIKSRHRRNARVYRSRKSHKNDEKTQSLWN